MAIFALAGIDALSVEVFHWISELPHYMLLVILIFMPTLGYWDQLRKMIKEKTSDFFKMEPALILIFTNFLRFIYWKSEPFEAYLLGQSIAVFGVQILLSVVSFYYSQSKHDKIGFSNQYPRTKALSYFFKPKDVKNARDFLLSLVIYGVTITLVSSIFSLILGTKRLSTVIILIANIVDTTVSLPQFTDVVMKHQIGGVSVVLVAQYLIGDVLKLIMFTVGNSAWPFVLGAALQTAIDLTVAVSFVKQSKAKKRAEYVL